MGTRQLIIDERRHEALKLRAKALQLSEEELVRRAIDAVLVDPSAVPPPPPDHRRAADEFVEAARMLAESRGGAEPYRFSREDLYQEREARWTPPG